MKAFSCIVISLFAAQGLAAGPGQAAAAKPAEPELKAAVLVEPTFGDDRMVEMLGELATDKDMVTKAWAVADLGETHNHKALAYIRLALDDKQAAIRSAAVAAAAESGWPEANEIIIGALKSDNVEVLSAAMRAVRDLGLSQASKDLGKLLANDDPLIRATALDTLTQLDVAAGQGPLRELLSDSSTHVRLAALRNAMLLDKAYGLTDALLADGGDDNPPGVRSLAFEAIGKFAWPQGQRIVTAAGQDGNPLVRRGVVRAYRNAGSGPAAAGYLNDRSAMVRLAAIRAAGDLHQKAMVGRLFDLLFAAKDDMTRQAARIALAQIGTDKVAATAASELPRWAEMPRPGPSSRSGLTAEQITANIASCSWLLGELHSTKALDYQLAMLPKTDVVSPVLLSQVPALGKIGDPKAIGPLVKLLDRCRERGQAYLDAMMSGRPGPPWDPRVPSGIVRTLGQLKAYGSLKNILALGKVTTPRGGRLDVCATAIIQSLPALTTPDNIKSVESFLLLTLRASPISRRYGLTPRFYAMKLAARMKLQAALPSLHAVLDKERPGWTMMRTAAWAIGEISGKTPQIGQPRSKQGGDWVVRKLKGY